MKLPTLVFIAPLLAVSHATPVARAADSSVVKIYGSAAGMTADTATCYLPTLITKKDSGAAKFYKYVSNRSGVSCQLSTQTQTGYCKYTTTSDPAGALYNFMTAFANQCKQDGGNYNNQLTPNGKK